MAAANPVNYSIAVPTFIGSLLSSLSSAVALGFQIARPPQRHFRHSLIVNLLVADFIYGFGNTISGAIFLYSGQTPSPLTTPSTACLVSGWFSQSNAQAVDFNILFMAIVVLLTITKRGAVTQLDLKLQILICVAAWIPGFITGTIGLALGSYGYVSGNWCWISSKRLGLRYGLSHGPRIAIFVITLLIYTYIYLKLRRIFTNLRSLSSHTDTRTGRDHGGQPSEDTQTILVSHAISISHELSDLPPHSGTSERSKDFTTSEATTHSTVTFDTRPNDDGKQFQASRMPAPPNVRRMLLMNGYPIAYIILWIPGIANRLAESVGKSPTWLTALQASTQYIGLINAITYGISEQVRRDVWKKLKDSTP
ncbi:G protein-coupled glucose receptor regulating Gpa2-domain-containing protein [Xylariaceae sp. FL1272]|nr:G protein-coupled glucose receptor regulating Gpa2-domain-containing protein [Xylariaceae sp. FL1272]